MAMSHDRMVCGENIVTDTHLKGRGHGHFQHVFLVSIVSLGGAEIKYHV